MIVPPDQPLVYVHATLVPSAAANSVQVLSMCEAFGRLHPDVVLAAFFECETNVAAHYGVDRTFREFPFRGRQVAGLIAGRSVAHLMQKLGRKWWCYTRIPAVAAATTSLGVPTIFELHAIPEVSRQYRAVRFATARRAMRRVVVISERLRVAATEQGLVRAADVLVAHDGATVRAPDETPVPRLREQFGLPTGVQLVGYAGSLKADKGVGVLLDAVVSHPSAHVAIAGAAPSATYEELKRKYEGPRVHFIGQVRPAEISAFLRACDVLAGPFRSEPHRVYRQGRATRSLDVHEFMSPLKVFEAFASGRPFVVSDLPVLREVIEPERNCLAVPPDDANALRAAIERCLSEDGLGSRLAAGGRNTLHDYTWDRRAASILAGSTRHLSVP